MNYTGLFQPMGRSNMGKPNLRIDQIQPNSWACPLTSNVLKHFNAVSIVNNLSEKPEI